MWRDGAAAWKYAPADHACGPGNPYIAILEREVFMTEPHTTTELHPDVWTKSPSSEESAALQPPTGYDPDWRARIEIARLARDQARKARGNGPVVFRHPRLPL